MVRWGYEDRFLTKRLLEGNISSIVPIKDSTKTFLFRLIGIMVVHTVVQNGPVIKIPRMSQAIISAMIDEPLDVIHSQLSKHDVSLNASTENLHYLIKELDSNSLKVMHACKKFLMVNGKKPTGKL